MDLGETEILPVEEMVMKVEMRKMKKDSLTGHQQLLLLQKLPLSDAVLVFLCLMCFVIQIINGRKLALREKRSGWQMIPSRNRQICLQYS
jgi:hypothetical protein